MSFYQLPPVGNVVSLRGDTRWRDTLREWIQPFNATVFGSATTALAATLLSLRATRPGATEVMFPAYSCPSIVSAILYAGCKPVAVDLARDRPWMDLEAVASGVGVRTLALVAVDLCGIPERYAALRTALGPLPVTLIQDSAQYFPARPAETDGWQGYVVIVSFGRGKPVSLLHGGAVLWQDEDFGRQLTLRQPEPMTQGQGAHTARTVLYNLLSHPRCYWLPAKLPFLGLGATRFSALSALQPALEPALALLGDNLERHRQRGAEAQARIRTLLASVTDDAIRDLGALCGVPSARRLNRYPVLVREEQRESLLAAAKRQGLGVSILYPAPVVELPGVREQVWVSGGFPEARRFARQLLTFPTHQRVQARDIAELGRILQETAVPSSRTDQQQGIRT